MEKTRCVCNQCNLSILSYCAAIHNAGVHFVSGGVSGCVATFCVQPFDLLRTRLVSQGEPKVKHQLKFHGMTHKYNISIVCYSDLSKLSPCSIDNLSKRGWKGIL